MSIVLASEFGHLGLATTSYTHKGLPLTRRYFHMGSVYSFDCSPLRSDLGFEEQRPIVPLADNFLFVEWVGARTHGASEHLDVSVDSYLSLSDLTLRPTDVLDLPVCAVKGSDKRVIFSYTVTRRRMDQTLRGFNFSPRVVDSYRQPLGSVPPLLKMTTLHPESSSSNITREIAFLNSDRASMESAVRMMRRVTITSSWTFVRDFLYGYNESHVVREVFDSQIRRFIDG